MINQDLHMRFAELSTPLIADACLRVGLPPHVGTIPNIILFSL